MIFLLQMNKPVQTGQELEQLRTMAKAYQVADREMIRKLIREEYHRNGEAYKEHLSGRIEQQEDR